MDTCLGYPDLEDPDYVFDALLGYGMFTEKLPPCFTSEPLLNFAKNKYKSSVPNAKKHQYIEYRSSRNTRVCSIKCVNGRRNYYTISER